MENQLQKLLDNVLPVNENPTEALEVLAEQAEGDSIINAILDPIKEQEWQYVYLHYGIKDNYMFYALGGSFASDAWKKSDVIFVNMSGEKFMALTSDDGKEYNISTRGLRRLQNFEEFKKFWDKSCDLFKLMVKAHENKPRLSFKQNMDFIMLCSVADKFSIESLKKYLVESFGFRMSDLNF